jgi:hypothetical protein
MCAIMAVVLFCAGMAGAMDAEIVTVDLSRRLGPAKCRASGFLHSISPTSPPDEMVVPLRPSLFRLSRSAGGDADAMFKVYPRVKAMGAVVHEVLGPTAASYEGRWPGEDGDWSEWDGYVRRMIEEARAAGVREVQWEVWNEPDTVAFWNPPTDRKKERFFETWEHTWHLIREVHPDGVIVGPSSCYYDTENYPGAETFFTLEEFLVFASERSVMPDVLCFHIWFADHVGPQLERLRAFAAEEGMELPPIAINEFGDKSHWMEPGAMAWYFGEFERMGVEVAGRACWGEPDGASSCWSSNLNGLTRRGDHRPRSVWWAYKAYAEITGELVGVSLGEHIRGVAGVDEEGKAVRVLVGHRNHDRVMPVRLVVAHLEEAGFLANAEGKVRLKVQRIPYRGFEPLDEMVLVRDEMVAFAETMELELPEFGARDAYVLTLRAE